MASLSVAPSDTPTAGLILYDFRFDKTAQFADPTIASDHALDEFDLYATWTPEKWFTLSSVLGFAVPGKGRKQAAPSVIATNGPAGRAVGSTIVLGEVVATVKFRGMSAHPYRARGAINGRIAPALLVAETADAG